MYASPELSELTSVNMPRTTLGVRKISLKSAGPFGSGGHCSPSHSCTAKSRGPKRASTVCNSERAENSIGFAIAEDVVNDKPPARRITRICLDNEQTSRQPQFIGKIFVV